MKAIDVLIPIRLIAALVASLSLAFSLHWGAAALVGAGALTTGFVDKSLGREISDRFVGTVTDNQLSWGTLIFGPYLGIGIGAAITSQYGLSALSVAIMVVGMAFWFGYGMRTYSQEVQGKVGAVAAGATALLLIAEWLLS